MAVVIQNPRSSYDYLFKILLIGDINVGKTCIVSRYSDDTFTSIYIATVGVDFKIKTLNIDGKTIKLQIWDTAGQERFQTMTASYYRGAHGIMLVYDITDLKTFDNITRWLGNIQAYASPNVQKFLIGNKCDLEDKRCISLEDGKRLAESQNVLFAETSAKANINIDSSFLKITELLLEKNLPETVHTTTTTLNPADDNRQSQNARRRRKWKCF